MKEKASGGFTVMRINSVGCNRPVDDSAIQVDVMVVEWVII